MNVFIQYSSSGRSSSIKAHHKKSDRKLLSESQRGMFSSVQCGKWEGCEFVLFLMMLIFTMQKYKLPIRNQRKLTRFSCDICEQRSPGVIEQRSTVQQCEFSSLLNEMNSSKMRHNYSVINMMFSVLFAATLIDEEDNMGEEDMGGTTSSGTMASTSTQIASPPHLSTGDTSTAQAARIRFKTLMLAYKAKNGQAPLYLIAVVKSRSVPQALQASNSQDSDLNYADVKITIQNSNAAHMVGSGQSIGRNHLLIAILIPVGLCFLALLLLVIWKKKTKQQGKKYVFRFCYMIISVLASDAILAHCTILLCLFTPPVSQNAELTYAEVNITTHKKLKFHPELSECTGTDEDPQTHTYSNNQTSGYQNSNQCRHRIALIGIHVICNDIIDVELGCLIANRISSYTGCEFSSLLYEMNRGRSVHITILDTGTVLQCNCNAALKHKHHQRAQCTHYHFIYWYIRRLMISDDERQSLAYSCSSQQPSDLRIKTRELGVYLVQRLQKLTDMEYLLHVSVTGLILSMCVVPHLLYVAGEEVITLQVLEGKNATLHTGKTGLQSVPQILWLYRSEDLKIVDSKVSREENITAYNSDKFRDRLQLDRNNGSLTIANINREDSGVYTIQINNDQRKIWSFSVVVYAPVSKPVIRNQPEHHPGSSTQCSPLCTVENGRDVNLSWYEGKQRISSIPSTDSSKHLNLPLNISELNKTTYTCVAANPVSNQTTQLSITELCSNTGSNNQSSQNHNSSQCAQLISTFDHKAGEEVITLQVQEGNTVTIDTGKTGLQSVPQILWFYGPENIKIVDSQITGGEIITDYNRDRFRDRLQLDRNNGSLTIRNISREDSGVYKLQINKKEREVRNFSVVVNGPHDPTYSKNQSSQNHNSSQCTRLILTFDHKAPVSKPSIINQLENCSVSHREACSPLCTVENGKDVSLSWYEEKGRISSITSTDSSEHLYLPLSITHLNSTYICVAANPVSNQTAQINITEFCHTNAGLLCVAGEFIRLQELEGKTVTIHTGIIGVQSDARIMWFYGPENINSNIVDSRMNNGTAETDYYRDRFRGRLQLDRNSGSLTIRNISRNDSGVYMLEILTKRRELYNFSVNVTDLCFPPCAEEKSNAFDTVNHKILLSVLTDLGITGTAWNWFESYLEDRHHQSKLSFGRLLLSSLINSGVQTTGSLASGEEKDGFTSYRHDTAVLVLCIRGQPCMVIYAPVSKPVIRNQPEHHPGSSTQCFPLCTVENGRDVNLSWYEEKERISSITSTDSSERLYLPLNISELNKTTYTCVAANTVSNQTTQLDITNLCPNT
ncbi:hypothetical protein NFI96_010644, partial [Prochilodus magdalenae]